MLNESECSATKPICKNKKRKNIRSSFSVPPQGLDCATAKRSRVLDIDIPPKSPFGKGGLRQGSRLLNVYKQKIRWKNHRTFCCTPSGARTLDPNIKSVVLYQLS